MFNALAPGYQFKPQTFGITPDISNAPYGGGPGSTNPMAFQPNMLAMMNQLAQVLQAVSLLGGGFADFAGAAKPPK